MNYENDQVITYSVQGNPLTREGIQQEISRAEAEYSKGNYTTQEQLKEDIKTWTK